MAAGDITRTVAKTRPTLELFRVEMMAANPNQLAVGFRDQETVITCTVRNGVCQGWNDTTAQVISVTLASGLTDAIAAFRTGTLNQGRTALVNFLITNNVLVVTGSVA